MKSLKPSQLENNEFYLVYTGYNWLPSGFDIAQMDDGELISQTTNGDLFADDNVKEIFQLPLPKDS